MIARWIVRRVGESGIRDRSAESGKSSMAVIAKVV